MKPAVAAALCASALLAGKPPVETAWDLIAKGDRAQAIELLTNTIATQPRNGEARLLLGSLYMEAGQSSESIAQLTEAVRLMPKSADAHNALGEAYTAFGQAKSARPEFERAVALNPNFAQAHVNLGAALLNENELAPAAQQLDAALRLIGRNPDAAYPRYLRAKIYTGDREPAKAAAELEQAVALRPDFAEAWSDLGEARRSLGDDKGALAAYAKAVFLNPDDAVAQTRLGNKLLDAGDTHGAIQHLREAVRLDPKNQTALYALQTALRRDGRAAEAEAVKKQLAVLIHDRDRADQALVKAIELNNKGAELEKKGDLRGALERYRSALDLLPDHVGIRTNFAVALLKLGHWNEGIAQMREALRRDPANETLRKGLEDALSQAKAHGIALSPQ